MAARLGKHRRVATDFEPYEDRRGQPDTYGDDVPRGGSRALTEFDPFAESRDR
jgi:hypothetical protein